MFDLDTVEDADEYLDKAIETKKLASKKDVNTTKDVEEEEAEDLILETTIMTKNPVEIDTISDQTDQNTNAPTIESSLSPEYKKMKLRAREKTRK